MLDHKQRGELEANTTNYEACALFDMAIKRQFGIAMWRLPNEQNQHLIIDTSGQVKQTSVDFKKQKKGFVLSPFQNSGDKTYFIRADLHFKADLEKLHLSSKGEQVSDAQLCQFIEDYRTHNKKTSKRTPYFTPKKPLIHTQQSQKAYEHMIQHAIESIKQQAFQKVVLSRSKHISLAKNFDIIHAFKRLCRIYPSAFVALVSLPHVGTWLCASPELLVGVTKDNLFKTVALAGTQSGEHLEDLKQALWRQKEIEEQALVSRYIINCFKKIRLRAFEELGPRTIRAGNLIHLQTEFTVNMNTCSIHNLPASMLSLLHPTSAVCGMPKDAATDYILKHETYDRDLYSGYLGTTNIENQSAIFVHLRCMQILENEAILYAGGGITQDSHPHKEWQETEMKFKVMMKAL